MTPSLEQLEHYMRHAENFAGTTGEVEVAAWARDVLISALRRWEAVDNLKSNVTAALFKR